MRSRRRAFELLWVVIAGCGGGGSPGGGVDASTAIDANTTPDATPEVTIASLCATDGVLPQLVGKILQCNPAFDFFLAQGQATPMTLATFCQGALGGYVTDGAIKLPSYAQLTAC